MLSGNVAVLKRKHDRVNKSGFPRIKASLWNVDFPTLSRIPNPQEIVNIRRDWQLPVADTDPRCYFAGEYNLFSLSLKQAGNQAASPEVKF